MHISILIVQYNNLSTNINKCLIDQNTQLLLCCVFLYSVTKHCNAHGNEKAVAAKAEGENIFLAYHYEL